MFDGMNRRRRPWLLLFILVAVVLGACTDGNPSEELPPANLSGTVYGYEGTADLTVLAISIIDDETTLASGTLFAPPNSRVQADLTPLSEVPASALSGEYACPELQITPANLKGAAFVGLTVIDGDAAIGQLIYVNFNPAIIERAPGDAFFAYFLADVAGSVRGTCSSAPSNTQTYDLDLAKGWNAVRWQVDAVAPSGVPTEWSFTIGTPPSNAAWYFTEFAEPDPPSE